MKELRPGFPGESLYQLAEGRQEACVSATGASLVRFCVGGIEVALPMPGGEGCRGGTYAGCTVGPVAGRVAGGILHVDGIAHRLTQNEGENSLHGGPNNLSARVWRVEEHGAAHIVLSCALAHGENGFPGNRRFTASYTLTGGALRVEHTAVTDAPTVVSLTNHTYWNLSGCFSAAATGHLLHIPAGRVWHNSPEHLPRELALARGTVFDFSAPCPPESRAENDATGQLAGARGYNNAYLLEGTPAVTLSHAPSGRTLTVETDYPALVFYSGGYLGPDLCTAGGEPLAAGCAYAFEPQLMPCALPVLYPGEQYHRFITLRTT